MKKIIPYWLKVKLKILLKNTIYFFNTTWFKIVRYNENKIKIGKTFKIQITLTQEIKNKTYRENKIHNLKLAAEKINNQVIEAGRIFSFWTLVKNPTIKNGYKVGRCIVEDKVTGEVGGGLCHLSGLLYYLALKAGLEVIERHSHSYDIYTEEERYTPLGSDATVVYGYKDLKIKNSLTLPFCFRIEVGQDSVMGNICSNQQIKEYPVHFNEKRGEDIVVVKTKRELFPDNFEDIGIASYLIHKK